MSRPQVTSWSAAFKERAVKLAVESDQTVAQTARDLGGNEQTWQTWLSQYHEGVMAPKAASTLRTSMMT